jgi:hypothetical protein
MLTDSKPWRGKLVNQEKDDKSKDQKEDTKNTTTKGEEIPKRRKTSSDMGKEQLVEGEAEMKDTQDLEFESRRKQK